MSALKLSHRLSDTNVGSDSTRVDRRLAQWEASFNELPPCEKWLLRQCCVHSVRLDQCAEQEEVLTNRATMRSGVVYENDRKLEVEKTAIHLAKQPAVVIKQLQADRWGSLWIVDRWTYLAGRLQANGDWTIEERSRALDLLGTPIDEREGITALDHTDPSQVVAKRLAKISFEVDLLTHFANTELGNCDIDQSTSLAKGGDRESNALIDGVRKYAALCRKRFEWAWNQIKRFRKSTKTTLPEALAGAPKPELAETLENFDTPEDDFDFGPVPTLEEIIQSQFDKPAPAGPIAISAHAATTSNFGSKRYRRAQSRRRRNA